MAVLGLVTGGSVFAVALIAVFLTVLLALILLLTSQGAIACLFFGECAQP